MLHHRMPNAYTFILVIRTPTVPYNAPLVWYDFTVYSLLASVLPLEKTFVTGPAKIDHMSANYTELYFR